MVAFGSEDHRVAERCFELYNQGRVAKIIVTGGVAQDPEGQMPVAERLKIHLASKGVPSGAIATIVDCTNILDAVHAMLQPGTGK